MFVNKMTAEELCLKYSMSEHIENGFFFENHYISEYPGRPASGSIYYYVAPDEKTMFHSIDCDEYWIYNLGSSLDVWLIDKDGSCKVHTLGVSDGCDPVLYIKSGTIFASRHSFSCSEGTFVTCITVPRFEYSGFKLYENKYILDKFPQVRDFFS